MPSLTMEAVLLLTLSLITRCMFRFLYTNVMVASIGTNINDLMSVLHRRQSGLSYRRIYFTRLWYNSKKKN